MLENIYDFEINDWDDIPSLENDLNSQTGFQDIIVSKINSAVNDFLNFRGGRKCLNCVCQQNVAYKNIYKVTDRYELIRLVVLISKYCVKNIKEITFPISKGMRRPTQYGIYRAFPKNPIINFDWIDNQTGIEINPKWIKYGPILSLLYEYFDEDGFEDIGIDDIMNRFKLDYLNKKRLLSEIPVKDPVYLHNFIKILSLFFNQDVTKENKRRFSLNWLDISYMTTMTFNKEEPVKNSLIKVPQTTISTHGVCENMPDIFDISRWDVSNVKDMSFMFWGVEFTGDLIKWDVSNVENMRCMFANSQYNGDLSAWDVSHVKDMSYMFSMSTFNSDISHWDVGHVTNMSHMFDNTRFNGDISLWDVRRVYDMEGMFSNSVFNGDISQWNTGNVRNMCAMFYESQFNGDLSKWDISNVGGAINMFKNSCFTGDIHKWDLIQNNNMKYMEN